MSASSRHSPVEVLRAPETRVRQVHVVDFEPDEATASLAGAGPATRPSRPFCFPPSPPYTNSLLKRAIPLPLLDEVAYRAHNQESDSMRSAKACGQRVSRGVNGASTLLSPPYSPRRRLLTLLSVDESEEEPGTPLASVLSSSDESGSHSWRGFDESDASEPPPISLKDVDLGEESDDWDDPVFLNAPSALDSSDGLDLNLFGGLHHSDDEGPPPLRLDPPSSPSMRSSSLPDLDDEPHGTSKPLFDPSDFDVFENGWDAIISDSTQISPCSSQTSEEDLTRLQHVDIFASGGPIQVAQLESPSRRSVVDLPGDDPCCSGVRLLGAPATTVACDVGRLGGQLLEQIFHPNHNMHISTTHRPFDIPSEIFQSPFNIPLPLAFPPTCSLLFSPPDPQDIPLPESPENRALDIPDNDFDVPSHMLEESRLRALQQEMRMKEAHARNREALLADYISRLNSMKPPAIPPPMSIPVYYSRPQASISDPGPVVGEKQAVPSGPSASPEVLHLEIYHRPPQAYPCSTALSYNTSVSGPSASDFLQARRREVQNALALRAAERRRRKRAKERWRELEALLQLKAGRLGAEGARELAASSARGRSDEVVVLTASDTDRRVAHVNAMPFDGADKPDSTQKDGKDEIRQLVARMIFRRRDSPRPLSGKHMPRTRAYIRSSLSRVVQSDPDDADDWLGAEEADAN